MKIGQTNKKPKISEDSSSEEEKNNTKKKPPKINDVSTEILLPNPKSVFKPGTTISPIVNNRCMMKNNLAKDLIKNEEMNTTVMSDRFNGLIENFNNQQKKLDNSYEDYWFYEIVDDDSFSKFKQYVQEYISKRLFDKTNKLYSNLRKQLSDTIAHDLNNVHSYYDIISRIINKHCNKQIKEKSCFESMCSCCKKPKKKNKLMRFYNMQSNAVKLTNDISDITHNIKTSFDEKEIEKIFPTPTEETKNFCDEKAKKFLDKKNIDERLREEVEFYSKYFKIENIIEKQKNTIKTQEEKKNQIKETRELNVCIICLEFQRNIMFKPCHHLICCQKCANDNEKNTCPLCGKIIKDKIDIDINI